MNNHPGTFPDPEKRPSYRWPWFVLAAVLLGIVLAVLWMSQEIARTRRSRDWNVPPLGTNRSAISPGPSSPEPPRQA